MSGQRLLFSLALFPLTASAGSDASTASGATQAQQEAEPVLESGGRCQGSLELLFAQMQPNKAAGTYTAFCIVLNIYRLIKQRILSVSLGFVSLSWLGLSI